MKRAGAFAIYLESWHIDFLDFLDMCKRQGEDRRRGQDLFYAASVSDLFIKRIKENGTWTLFDPVDVPELSETWGEEFEKYYLQAEDDFKNNRRKFNLNTKTINMSELISKMVYNWSTEGKLFWFFKDTVNREHEHKNLGIIRSSNLCVSGDTNILTKDYGNKPIKELVESGIVETECWNGNQWSLTKLVKTADSSKLLTVILSNGSIINATEYHKWYIDIDGNETEVRTIELQPNAKLYKYYDNEGNVYDNVRVVKIEDHDITEATYCGNEPLRHRLMFNGVLTGNCTEITMPTSETSTAVCNLGSINISRVHSTEDLIDTSKVIARMLDNVIDVTDYHSSRAGDTQKAYRSYGVGSIGEAEYLATHKIMFGSKEHEDELHRIYGTVSKTLKETSIELAKEKGSCVIPGIRNAYRMAIAPNTSSGLLAGSTCSCEPIYSREWMENSKLGAYKMVAPHVNIDNISYYKNAYELDQGRLLELTAIRQKYIDMAISHSLYIDPTDYMGSGRPVSAMDIIKLIVKAHKLGVKTLYYFRAKARSNKNVEAKENKISCVGCEN